MPPAPTEFDQLISQPGSIPLIRSALWDILTPEGESMAD